MIRTCVYTRTKSNKKNMIRLVKNDDNKFVIDHNQKIQKRAIYIYPCNKVIDIIKKNKKYLMDDDVQNEVISIIKAGEIFE